MKFVISLLPLFFFFAFNVQAQQPKKIYELKSLTDSSRNDHLFYRIHKESEDFDDYSDHIYHYDVASSSDSLFLSDYYQGMAMETNKHISDYKFFDKNPNKHIYIEGYNQSVYVNRSDTEDGVGGFLAPFDELYVEGPDSGRVYVELGDQIMIGRNGGRDWPDYDPENPENIPDSSILDFPLQSLSPYNDSLMFGGNGALVRSTDRGKTSELISDTLRATNIEYDADSTTIYLLGAAGVSSSSRNSTSDTDSYVMYRSGSLGKPGTWEPVKTFNGSLNLVAHPAVSGKLYAWNTDSIMVSEDYGAGFELLVDPEERITGFSATASSEYYTTTSKLYQLQDEQSVELKSIPVAIESPSQLPDQTQLLQNYPNPFNPATTIRYTMRTEGRVAINLYTVTGKLVKELVNDNKAPGTYSFRFNAGNMSSGIYIVRAVLGEYRESKTITLIK